MSLLRNCKGGTIKLFYLLTETKGRRYYTEEQYKKYMGIQEELVQDLISIIHVFSCRIYGLRKYKKKMSEDEDL